MRVYCDSGDSVDLCHSCLDDVCIRERFRIPAEETPDLLESRRVYMAAAEKGDPVSCEACGRDLTPTTG